MAGQTEMIITGILQSIDDGALNPGDLIEDSTLIARYGVSRTPVREALIQLEAEGLLIRAPRKGAVIFKPTLEQFLSILEVHAKLEGQAAGLAARRLSAKHASALEAATVACEAHAKQHGDNAPDAYYQLNLDFHRVVAEAAGNTFLLDMIKSNARKLMAYYRARYHYRGVIAASAVEHRQITTLILARDSGNAEKAMEQHVSFDHVTAMDLLAALS
ncbi:GntR family transcriptional regulator [Lentibacter algarum]|uniref:GntR family transcriptional regulator n=1 Tax=Lentibacter algarum TaxID=576131 RepID=UPI001C09391B|nr:GntR family transcriptional regulator [Lentibacter algarum]MBU2983192.1 GntR family transcriptional regulator [Lentibacter algarum]